MTIILSYSNCANCRCVFKADVSSSPFIGNVLDLFHSDPFCLLLSHLTGLQLSNMYSEQPPMAEDGSSSSKCINTTAKDTTAYCHGDVLLWKTGCYTLMHPQDDFLLELVLHFNANGALVVNLACKYIC